MSRPSSLRPFGYFLHHQGRGHIERCAAIIAALPPERPVTVFCARPDLLTDLPSRVRVIEIPSLFEASGAERVADWVQTPDTLHCAPLGWPGIRKAMGRIAAWFVETDPALIICDVSAEVAQLARICSVPHVKIVQHGIRTDPGHRAAYDGAVGLLVPSDERLAQPDWTTQMLSKSLFVGGLGIDTALPERSAARTRLGIDAEEDVVLVLSGAGGDGISGAPLAVGARAMPQTRWITVGKVARDWHATEPSNLEHHGWVDKIPDYLAATDLVVASTGNTTCQRILSAGLPWVAIPEWRYFDEQLEKSRALERAGVALHLPSIPASMQAWRDAIKRARAQHRPALQRSMVQPDAAARAARWLEDIATRLDIPHPLLKAKPAMPEPVTPISVLTIARGRAGHLRNLVRGLAQQRVAPSELVIGAMQEELYPDLPATDFPIRQIRVEGDELPLAKARNAVAQAAVGELLIFLDVDCIPDPTLVADYAAQTREGDGLTMGEMLYLPSDASGEGWTYAGFADVAVRHSDRQGPPSAPRKLCEDYRCFWSLTFAMHRTDWNASGGFDERFVGYGGEDTDFGRTLHDRCIPIWWLRGARAYHQYHPHCMPPIHHIPSILRNTEIFARKWGYRTMEHWLHGFRMMGLIENGPDGLRILRDPGPADFDLCRQSSDMPYAASGPVIRQLEDREREARGLSPTRADPATRHSEMTRAQEALLTTPTSVAAE